MVKLRSQTRGWHVTLAVGFCAAASLVVAAVSAAAVQGAGVHDGPAAAEPVSLGGPVTVRRLDEAQYKRSIAQVFGPGVKVPGRFEPPVREDGLLAIGDSKVVVTPSGAEQYALRAREISAQVVDDAHWSALANCSPQAKAEFDEACAQEVFAKYGRQLFRRPLSDGEMDSALALARRSTTTSGNFHKGVGAGLASLLASPAFIFRIENTEPDPAHTGASRLDAYALASRISFLPWDGPPDEEIGRASCRERV